MPPMQVIIGMLIIGKMGPLNLVHLVLLYLMEHHIELLVNYMVAQRLVPQLLMILMEKSVVHGAQDYVPI